MDARIMLIALALLGCDRAARRVVAGTPESLAYARELNVKLSDMAKRPSGLYVQDVTPGVGATVGAGQVAQVHYTGWLADGMPFDSSTGGQPLEFRVANGEVIAGWDEGVTGMRVGGKRRLVIPPHLAYGDAGAGGVIPPGATLVFDVELVGIR